jgi:superfamily II DNA or RNA helicase
MLRDYQTEDLSKLRDVMKAGERRTQFQGSVGYGKTRLIKALALAYSNAGRVVWVLSNRSAVVQQLDGHAGHLPGVIVMTVQAADRRRETLAQRPAALVLIDEAHMGGAAPQYQRVLECSPHARVVAFTGTPTPELFEAFPGHVEGRGARWLTDNGFLSPLRYHTPSFLDLRGVAMRKGEYDDAAVVRLLEERRVYGKTLDSYREKALGVPTLGFCVNVKHAASTAEEFRKAGHACEVLTGLDNAKEVERKIEALRDGGLVFSVDKVSAGFDLPDLRVILSIRPTASEQLWVQQLGRVARAAEGKPFGLVIDHVGNSRRLGSLTEERDWRNLDKTKAQRLTADGDRLSIRTCDACLGSFEAGPSSCPYCGASLAKETRIPKAESIRLEEVAAEQLEKERQAAKETRKRQGQTIPQMRTYLGHKTAVDNMRKRYDKAKRNGDDDIAAFAHEQLRQARAL